ncbi:hypothetical protein C8J56DRAFT_957779 [Mycena floridula]|nr:hypothetical protein C8J56DRAFT_957779 [Mycena floridula]
MLTLAPGSYCDVCAEEYGPHCLPHSIPCGHVLCASCCSTIAEKTPPRLSPACPFCRETFTPDAARLIRTDFSSSGWSTPRRVPISVENLGDSASDLWARKTEKLLNTGNRGEVARRLEDRVARVAHKKCSVEEVSTLHTDLEEWLTSAGKTSSDQNSSLYLSSALLRAILMNHVAHSEASKHAKNVEASLKNKLDDFEATNGKLEAELRRYRASLTQKAQECQTLRTELNRLRVVATTLGLPPSPSAASQRATSPPPALPTYSPSGLSRFNSVHSRSASVQAASRPSTPSASPVRSHTPTPTPRSHTSASMRSSTPGPNTILRSQTPAVPFVPPKPRRLSHPSPPRMDRSVSEEKQEVHERWIPPTADKNDKFYSSAPMPAKYAAGLSRTPSTTARYWGARSPSPAS